jgi:two-component system sensor kinase FixL
MPADAPHAELQRELENLAESIIETAQMIILVLDSAGRIVRFNPYLEEISGYRLSEVQGQDWFAVFVPEAERSAVRDRFLQTLRTDYLRDVTLLSLKDGNCRKIEWSVKTLKDSNHKLLGLFAIGQDVTERQRAEALLQSLIDTTQDAVITIDQAGRIEVFNASAERIFGYTREEILGQNIAILMPEPYASEHQKYIEHYERTGERRAIGRIRMVAAQRKNGQVFPIELSVAEIRTGNTVRYGAVIRDISEKVRLQEQLIERERLAAIGTTAATFAHEVGNPLNSMYMAAQLLERRLGKQRDLVDDTVLTPLRTLMNEMKRLLLLLEEFRSLARRQKLNLKPIALSTLITDVCAAEKPYYTAQNVTVEPEIAPDLPPIEADAEKLRQVLLNLCKNAVEAMPNGGKLTISVNQSGNFIKLYVKDTGIGLPPGIDIVEPFITTKAQGTGLGLTIVRQIISAHRGSLTYWSAPGEGTTFLIELPLSQGEKTVG